MATGEFNKESDFEHALINLLFQKGWESEVIKYPTEDDLVKNWAQILYDNNRQIDRLGDYPLTDSEMQQIINQINELRTPFNLNGFINGKTVSIKRDNKDDKLHFGKEVSLKIYDRSEIVGGQSRYQIAEQPRFKTPHPLKPDKRGDFMLLINGMPVFHVELKKSGIPLSQATCQIATYTHDGVFRRGILSLVQVFVAMTPEDMVYFANPGYNGTFNEDFFFHWENVDNVVVSDWRTLAEQFFYIPMAHQLIGFYMVADKTDGILKVMRSYQIYAARNISQKVADVEEHKWSDYNCRGGYIAHTTGSGKTLTSFKSALLIADSGDADKVVFLVDRIELDTQSTLQYKNFTADLDPEVQDTNSTDDLIAKLKNNDDVLIVTSIQKMSKIVPDANNAKDIERINSKRIVVILDECHRSTFGDMLVTIRNTFTRALYFGFTGTPIKDENKKKQLTTSDLFGDELHRYTIADGIRDHNVLGFDPYAVSTFSDYDLRRAVALDKAKAKNEEEVFADERKKRVYNYYMNEAKMAGVTDNAGNYTNGIEDEIPDSQYNQDKHRRAVVQDIKDKWLRFSQNNKYHALFATTSIPEAVEYYRLFKEMCPNLKVTCLFDPSTDYTGGEPGWKEDAIAEILDAYNKRFNSNYDISHYAAFKKDVSIRLAHKDAFQDIEPKDQLNILIVVDQMLTGYDSKWINTLYLDKMLRYEMLIQAFSRTNRIAGRDKPFGIIRYYRRVHTMKRNLDDALALYAGDKALEVFVNKLPANLAADNLHFKNIEHIFESAGIENFERLPDDKAERVYFAKEFHELSIHLEAALLQGFNWENPTVVDGVSIEVLLDEMTYNILLTRYHELFMGGNGGNGGPDEVPYDIDTHLTDLSSGKINTDYMNSRFTKYVRNLQGNNPSKEVEASLNDLHRSFAYLSKEEQKIAEIVLGDFQNGRLQLEEGKTLRDYITEYQNKNKNEQIYKFALAIGADVGMLKDLINVVTSEADLNAYGRFDKLVEALDMSKAKELIERINHATLSPRKVKREAVTLLSKFILEKGLDLSDLLGERLEDVNDDTQVKNFVDLEMDSSDGISINKLWADTHHEFSAKYEGMTSRDWHDIIKKYVLSKTQKEDMDDNEIFKMDMAAEP